MNKNLNEILIKFDGFNDFYEKDKYEFDIEKEKRMIVNENLVSIKSFFDGFSIIN